MNKKPNLHLFVGVPNQSTGLGKKSSKEPETLLFPKGKKTEYTALFNKKDFSSCTILEPKINFNKLALSDTNIITESFDNNSPTKNYFQDVQSKQVLSRDNRERVLECIDKSLSILKKIPETFNSRNDLDKVGRRFETKEINEESEKRKELYRSLFKDIRLNVSSILTKLQNSYPKNTFKHKNNSQALNSINNSILDDEEINDEKVCQLKENGGNALEEYSIPISKSMVEEYNSCDIPEIQIQEDFMNKPPSITNRFANNLGTLDLDLDYEYFVEKTQASHEIPRIEPPYGEENTKIAYNSKDKYYFKEQVINNDQFVSKNFMEIVNRNKRLNPTFKD